MIDRARFRVPQLSVRPTGRACSACTVRYHDVSRAAGVIAYISEDGRTSLGSTVPCRFAGLSRYHKSQHCIHFWEKGSLMTENNNPVIPPLF